MSHLVCVGGGPKTTGLLFALAAAARAARETFPEHVGITVIDPFPPGGGRIWRHDQSAVLWMNSLAEDVTIFADAEATVPYAPVTGPNLDAWAEGRDLGAFGAPEDGVRPGVFPTRRVQAEYLGWAFRRAVDALPAGIDVRVVRGRATGVEPLGEQYLVSYGEPSDAGAGRGQVIADAVVLAQGFIEVEDDVESATLRQAAREHGLGYIAPGYTADLDLSGLPAGEDVIVRGFGLAFIDAMMMVTEGRGGRFTTTAEGDRAYAPSGREPVLWVGSRRGIPYKSKLGYRPEGMAIAPTRWLTPATVHALRGPGGHVSAEDVIFPLLEAELATAHYVELASRGGGRTTAGPQDYVDLFDAWHAAFLAGDAAAAGQRRAEWIRFAEATVPDPADRFDLARLDRPFAGSDFESHAAFERAAQAYTRRQIDRAANPHFSQDSAVFHALLSAYFVIRAFVAEGLFTPSDRDRLIEGRLHGLFSYIASGPPPERLENLLALQRAGLVRFLGPDLEVRVDATPGTPAAFLARSRAHPGAVRATWLLDARLAPVSAARATDPLLRGLIAGGELRIEDEPGSAAKLLADAAGRAVRADGSVHDALFLVGPSVAGSTPEAFTRPGIDARVFQDNARLVEDIRAVLAVPEPGISGSGPRPTGGGETRRVSAENG